MKFLTEYLVFNTEKRIELLNITSEIEALVRKSGVKEGLCLKKLGGKNGGTTMCAPSQEPNRNFF